MKNARSLHIVFTLILLNLYSVALKSQVEEVQFDIENDSWGAGFTPIYDDFRTYGLNAKIITKKRFFFNGEFSYLTNRYDSDSSQRKALDEFLVNFGVPFFPTQEGRENDNLWITAGILFRGKAFGQLLQEKIHGSAGVSEVPLEYYSGNNVYANLGYQFRKTVNLPNQTWRIGLKNSLNLNLGYNVFATIGVPVIFGTDNNFMSFSTNYTMSKTFLEDNTVLKKVTKAESGFNLRYKVYTKDVFFYFDIYPTTGFSSGGVGFRLGKFKSNIQPFKKQVIIELSKLSNGLGYNFKYLIIPFTFQKRTAHVLINHNFHTLLKSYIPDYPNKNGHGNQLTFGTELPFLKQKKSVRIVEPYINLSVGFKGISTYSKVYDIPSSTSFYFATNNDLGVNISIPYRVKKNKHRLTFSIYYRNIFLNSLTPNKEVDFVNTKNNPYRTYQNAIGFGLLVRL